jgi:hypothetical protein
MFFIISRRRRTTATAITHEEICLLLCLFTLKKADEFLLNQ